MRSPSGVGQPWDLATCLEPYSKPFTSLAWSFWKEQAKWQAALRQNLHHQPEKSAYQHSSSCQLEHGAWFNLYLTYRPYLDLMKLLLALWLAMRTLSACQLQWWNWSYLRDFHSHCWLHSSSSGYHSLLPSCRRKTKHLLQLSILLALQMDLLMAQLALLAKQSASLDPLRTLDIQHGSSCRLEQHFHFFHTD